ncbi:MAG: hypothetical protein AAF456_18300 [Planctomycetota bacterium]
MFKRIDPGVIGDRILAMAMACLIAVSAAVAPTVLLAQSDAAPDRPLTEELLPETTVAYFEIRDIREFMEKMEEASSGELMRQKEIAALAGGIWEEANKAFEENVDIEMSLEEMGSIPDGEITIAAVAPRFKDMAFIFIIEVDDENENVDNAIEMVRGFAEDDGADFESNASAVEEDEVEFQTIVGNDTRITYFRKDGLMVASNNEDELNAVLDRWNGRPVERVRPLTENRKFATIMNRCSSTRDLPAEVRFFIDPIEFAKAATRGEAQAQIAINFLPLIGLDGVLGLGGAIIMNEDEFESVMHGHLLLASPRNGVLEMLALKPGHYEPEPWIPADCARYVTTVWDIPKMMEELEKVVDLATGEGTFREGLESQVNDNLGIDLEEDLLYALSGRITNCSWVEAPARFNSETNIFSMEIKDKERFEETMEVLMDLAAEQADVDSMFDVETHEGIDYWIMSTEFNERQEERREEGREQMREWRRQRAEENGEDYFEEDEDDEDNVEMEMRAMDPAFAIIGDDFVIGTPPFIKHAIDVYQGKEAALLDDEEYQMIQRKLMRLLDSDMPCMTMFTRPSTLMENLFDVAQSDNTFDMLDTEEARENEYVQGFRQVLEDNPLPAFEDIEHLFPPQGAYMTTDDTGFHFLFFGLKPDKDGEEDDDE